MSELNTVLLLDNNGGGGKEFISLDALGLTVEDYLLNVNISLDNIDFIIGECLNIENTNLENDKATSVIYYRQAYERYKKFINIMSDYVIALKKDIDEINTDIVEGNTENLKKKMQCYTEYTATLQQNN